MLAAALALAATTAHTAPPAGPVRGDSTVATATAVRAAQAPKIDGRAGDAVWKVAPRFGDFLQFDPHPGAPPMLRTEFQAAYDDRNLYVFVRMYDPHPDSILHALSRRDVRGPSDQIKLIIDSYGDRRTGYELAVNPDGVKRDYAISDDGQEDDTWDGIWEVATRVDSLGWTAEFRVPLSQLRYSNSAHHTFGFGVWRDIERNKERDSWPLYSPTRNGLASQLGHLAGLDGLTTAHRLEAVPYVVTRNVERSAANARLGRDQQITVGGDLKLGITPNVTLDATVNPDFGQVEADPAVVNLTAFETFFAERRPFFLEGTGLYQFALNCYIVVDCSTHEGLFYSRRIGRSPSLRDVNGDAGTASATPIAAAMKLTGRTGEGLSFGVLDALTPRMSGVGSTTVEPQTNYAVLRAQQDLRGGEAGVSVIATAVNRSLDPSTAPYLHKDAYVAGASFRNRFQRGNYELTGQLAASRLEGSAASIAATQSNSVHYFQRPGSPLAFDSTRTSLGGDEEQLKFGKYGGGITRFETSIVRQSAGFDVNELGYLRRADLVNWSTWASLVFREAHGIYRWAQLNGNYWTGWSTSGTQIDHGLNVNGHMGLNNNWDVHLGGSLNNLTTTSCDRCTRGGPLLRQSLSFAPWGGVNTDSRRTVSGGLWVNLFFGDAGRSSSTYLSPYVNLRVGTQFSANLAVDISHNDNDAQWYGNFADGAGATHYAFAHLNQSTVGTTLRLTYTATPNLTFEFYGQPFESSGTYADARELSATPGAARYTDRFTAYALPDGSATAFTYTQLRTNTVVRWEFRPGSTMFVVWAHGREFSDSQHSNESWIQDYGDLFALHPENTFLVKLAYWLNR